MLVSLPLIYAAYAVLGYTYTARALRLQFGRAGAMILAVVLLHFLLLRWLGLAQRKLAWAKARAAAGEGSKDVLEEEQEGGVDIGMVGQQVRALLRIASLTVVIAAQFVVWAEVLPALGFLREIEFGSLSTTVLIDGVETAVPLTLADILGALVAVVLTVVLGKNAPGLLEVVILSHLPISAGGRYATVTLVRYLIVIMGTVLAFQMIGIGWQTVQWLAAAVSVGLGFGLQEIFANFVSGLILLFERPVRVGDTVTVGEISGHVSRIRMRATTIIDWDRKELIIPNKEFITGQIINWSLSDALVRVKVPVGVAYGSDTQAVRRALLEAAELNQRVLSDPEPNVRFREFGDSTLNFELRVHVAGIDDYLAAVDELNEAIDRTFRRDDIEIAFPQRDLHLRSVSAALKVEGREGADSAPTVEQVRFTGEPEPS